MIDFFLRNTTTSLIAVGVWCLVALLVFLGFAFAPIGRKERDTTQSKQWRRLDN